MTSSGPWAGRRIHLIGIGGAGMSGWARVAAQLGATVSGSDQSGSEVIDRLRSIGITVKIGHDAANVPSGADVFHSTAVPAGNPERSVVGQESRPRADLLAELTAMAKVIAVAGAHGKTTTSSMAAHALLGAGMRPGYLIGGALTTTGENADWGAGEWLVVEADESDRSMLSLDTDVAVVLNIELDHHTTYRGMHELEDVFDRFRAAAPVCITSPELARQGDIVFDPGEVELTTGGSRFNWRGHAVRLTVPGAHNAANAAAALEACRLTGADEAALVGALASFGGAGRRFQRLGFHRSGAAVIDDYAHHPTEVAATIAAARTLGSARVIAWFQPHLYSRTSELGARFGVALSAADEVVVSSIYPARERREDHPGVSGLMIVEAAADAGATQVAWLPGLGVAAGYLDDRLREGDLLLAMGAGDIDHAARQLVDEAA